MAKKIAAMEKRVWKARELCCKKPIVKNLNLGFITEDLSDIQAECDGIRWYTGSEDGSVILTPFHKRHGFNKKEGGKLCIQVEVLRAGSAQTKSYAGSMQTFCIHRRDITGWRLRMVSFWVMWTRESLDMSCQC